MLRSPAPGDWLLWRRTYSDQGFSPLRQITSRTWTNCGFMGLDLADGAQ